MKQPVALFMLVVIGMALFGCVGPRPSVMPGVEITFLVLDDESGLPVPNASVYMQYEGPSGQEETRGPFVTDEAGRGLISLKKEVLWVSWSEAYFVGGYLRSITVSAPGYEDKGISEGFDYGAIKNKGSQTFRLKPFRNRFGSVLVTAEKRVGDAYVLELQILDGPHGGENYELRVVSMSERTVTYLGEKFYLRQSIESMEADKVRYKLSSFNANLVLRRGLPDEPYKPQ